MSKKKRICFYLNNYYITYYWMSNTKKNCKFNKKHSKINYVSELDIDKNNPHIYNETKTQMM